MTPAEEQHLRAWSAELAGAEQSPWEPRCVARAFASAPGALVLTMQGWIDLDAARSPLLSGGLPETVEDLTAAVDAFGLQPFEADPELALAFAQDALDAVNRAFEAQIRMRAAGATGSTLSGGFGDWLPILSCLIAQLGMTRLDALSTPVAQAFAIIAGHRHNQGGIVADATYAQRDATEATADKEAH